ncbi:DNA internalization-related competence protein ComEC/Rec2 [Haliea sp. E17]|uniref:DNA internalization-related competence protein ComEC/Rec2 n=1 Tax=Haliea sp. E17 TaxID=3401576 RepID=UPI003AADA24B
MRTAMAGWLLGMVLVAVLPALPSRSWLWACGAGGAALALLALPVPPLARCASLRPALALLAGLLLALACSGLRGHGLLAARLPVECNRAPLTVVGEVMSLPARTLLEGGAARQRFNFAVASLHPGSCAGPRNILLSYYGSADIEPGQRWQFEVRLRHPWGLANPGSFNVQSWYAVTAVHATGAVAGEGRLFQQALGSGIGHLRQELSRAIQSAPLSVPGAAVLRAVSVGDKSGIDHQLWTLCQQLGINHLLVISGLHVAMVAGLGLVGARIPAHALQLRGCSRAARSLPALAALAGAAAYTALAGFALPAQRALCMLSVVLLARSLWRRSAAATGLLVAAALVLALQPLALLGSGFWLSFGAVGGLLWQDQWRRHCTAPGRALRAHGTMAALMLPAGALWFGGASAVALLANLVLVPLFAIVVVPLALLGALLWWCGLPGADSAWQVAAWPVDASVSLAAAVAMRQDLFLQLPGGGAAAALGFLALALAFLPVGHCARVALLLLLLPLGQPANRLAPRPTLHLLDVGQGTAVVFTAGGRALLYDTGGGNPAGASLAQSVVLPWMRYHGIDRLADFIVSHGDYDHSGGAADVIDALPVERLWTGGGVSLSRPALPCRAGLAWQWPGGTRFRLLSPLDGAPGDDNDRSCVLQIDTGGVRILLPGDIGQAQERRLIQRWGGALESDVLLAGHHGSASSTSQSWLNFVDPQVVLIGAGYASRFGHPHPAVVARLEQQGVSLRQSALDGAVSLRATANGELEVVSWRGEGKTWWK